jgi:hypothetical protein
MHKGLKVGLIILGSLVGIVLLCFIILYVAGGQEVKDPFTTGIDVVDAPWSTPATVTWRLVGLPAGTKTMLCTSEVSRPAADGFAPADLGYTTSIEPRVETEDGAQVYKADVPAGKTFVRVYVESGNLWSNEYEMESS